MTFNFRPSQYGISRFGSKLLADGECWIDWAVCGSEELAESFVRDEMPHQYADGPGLTFARRPAMRKRKNGTVLVTQFCGLDI